jgi:hypothetical protein
MVFELVGRLDLRPADQVFQLPDEVAMLLFASLYVPG